MLLVFIANFMSLFDIPFLPLPIQETDTVTHFYLSFPQEILRRDWMFKLVGEDIFFLEEGKRCIIRVDPLPGFKYKYLLFVDGKPYEQYTESLSKALKIWEISLNDQSYRVVLEKDTLNVYLNGYLRSETVCIKENSSRQCLM